MSDLRENPPRRKRTGALKERAYDEIKQRIMRGEVSSGDFLTEGELVATLGMSKTPIRVALERLELEGYVRVSPQRGIVVRGLTVDEIADQFEIRFALESYAMRELAGKLTAEQKLRLEANIERQREAARSSDVAETVRLDTEFHLLFCDFLGNGEIRRVMTHLRDRISVVIRRIFFESGAERLSGSLDEHRGIARAVLSGNAELAVKRLRKHFEFGKRSLMAPRRD